MASTLAVGAEDEDGAGRGGGEEAEELEGHTLAMGGAGGRVEVEQGTMQEAAQAMVEVGGETERWDCFAR